MLSRGRRTPGGGAERWLGLLCLVLAAVYLAFGWGYLQNAGLFDYLGFDYRVFRASAEIASSRGFAQVYDLSVQEQFQRPLYDAYATGPARANYATSPMPYAPAFILFFMPLLLLPPVPGFAAWTALNGVLTVLVLWRFAAALGGRPGPGFLALAMVSYPAFLNLFLGQANAFLLLFWGGFCLSTMRRQGFRSGLWLGGLLLKPQALILVLPGLLLGRRYRALAGFAVAGLLVALLSLFLGGVQALGDLAQLTLRYTGELQTTVPELMMNWRALVVNLGVLIPSPVAWGLAITGLVLTGAAALSLWIRAVEPSSPRFALILLGTYAATCAVAWHAHIHMALPLLVTLLHLDLERRLPRASLVAWAALPALVFFVAAWSAPGTAPRLTGLSTLALNLYLLGWAVWTFWRQQAEGGAGKGTALAEKGESEYNGGRPLQGQR